ncbi:MAG: glycosyltransferase family 2 protein [Lachnospiraceae bacterium]|nr:glycosyltransferase family 2 protein [Lachnospiraceae bacterium]
MSMTNTVLVSIVIPVYKTKEYLEQCIQSLLAQTYYHIEILLVDDGSPDECPALCDSYAAHDKRVRVIHKENGGASFAREVGIKNATGDYIMFVDSDDWVELDTVACCVEIAQRDNVDCVMFGYIREYPGKRIITPLFEHDFSCDVVRAEEKIHRRIVGLKGAELREPQRVDFLSSMCMKLYRTEFARKGRIVSERVVGTSEDTIFNLYALEGCRISYINRCFYHYRKTNIQSITTQHKPDLIDKWDVMYSVVQEYIDGSGRKEEYQTPFLNRVACGMIGLGLNEVGSRESLWQKTKKLRLILDKPLYREAFAQLDISYCGVKWKVFFLLCKKKAVFLLAIMLQIINYLRSRVAA